MLANVTRQAKETYTVALVDNDSRRFHAIDRSSRIPDRYTLAYTNKSKKTFEIFISVAFQKREREREGERKGERERLRESMRERDCFV